MGQGKHETAGREAHQLAVPKEDPEDCEKTNAIHFGKELAGVLRERKRKIRPGWLSTGFIGSDSRYFKPGLLKKIRLGASERATTRSGKPSPSRSPAAIP